MESEGPQTTDGSREAPAETNVVRLDEWIGPRDELVPFGRRRPSIAQEAPSAEDFWGGSTDALEPPAEFSSAASLAGDAPTREAPTGTAAWRSSVRRLTRFRHPRRRRVFVAVAAALALATASSFALAMGDIAGSPPSRGVDATRVQMASALSDGLTRIFGLDLPLIEPRSVSAHRADARRGAGSHRHPPHLRSASEPVHYVPRPHTTIPSTQVTAYTARVTPPSQSSSTTTENSSEPASTKSTPEPRSTAASAPVSATGEAGALGPIQSPNG